MLYACWVVCNIQSTLDSSNTDILKYHPILKIQFRLFSYFHLHFKSSHLKLLISQSKFSGTRKFILKYQQSGMNFDFEISRVDCNLRGLVRVVIVAAGDVEEEDATFT